MYLSSPFHSSFNLRKLVEARETPLLYKRMFYSEHADLNYCIKKGKTMSYVTYWKHELILYTIRVSLC